MRIDCLQPAVRQRSALRGSGAAPGALCPLARIWHRPVERSQQIIELLQRLHGGEPGPQVAADASFDPDAGGMDYAVIQTDDRTLPGPGECESAFATME